MKILLIHPPVFNDLGRKMSETPPSSLLYLGGFMEKMGYRDLKIIDADHLGLTWPALKERLLKENPDIVGITSTSLILPSLIKTAEIARQSLPNCLIVAGGFGPTKEPEKVLEAANRAVKFVVMGEGEMTFLELVKHIENKGGDFHGIKGLAYLDENKGLVMTSPREPIMDLDSLPWPAYHLLEPDFSQYPGMPYPPKEMPRPIATMFASRGCPHRCIFCSLGSHVNRRRNPKDIVDEIEFYKNKYQVRSVQLYDDEFIGLNPKQNDWIEAICDEIIKRGLHKSLAFLVQGRCSQFIELGTFKKMREANFVWIWWGVESGSPKVLGIMKKDIEVPNIIRTFALAREAGIKSLMFILVGLPGETPADIKLTVDLIKKVKPDCVRSHMVIPYPGSELREYLQKHNLLDKTEGDYRLDTRYSIIHHTPEMSAQEIRKYYRMLVFRFEMGYGGLLKFWIKSLATLDGWKKLLRRTKTAFDYFWRLIKVTTS